MCTNVTFVLGGKELLSHEGNAQGDPISMAIYRVALRPLRLANFYPEKDPKIVAFADDLTSAGRLSKLRNWRKVPLDVDPNYGCFRKPTKTIILVKPGYESKTTEIFDNTNIKITSSGQRHLGAVVNCIEKNTSKQMER